MARILSLETSTTVCSVAIHENESLLALSEIHIEHSHASKVASLIYETSKLAGVEILNIDAVAVSSGPGSYTGLRIGTSTAKGICYALSVPLIAIDTLSILAAQVNNMNVTKALLCPMIDARRMEVYCSVSDSNGSILQGVEARVIDENSFEEWLNKRHVLFFGNGADKCKEVIRHENANFISGITPTASQLGAMAFQKYQGGEVEDLFRFEPFYLKEFRVKKPTNFVDTAPNKIV